MTEFLTEAEARTKQCPVKTQCINESLVLQDNRVPLYAQSPCIASNCIAWRWQNNHVVPFHSSECRGYCGLAGRPE